MGSKQLTLNQKAKWTPIILQRDFPEEQTPHCFFCKKEFIDHDQDYQKEWEHLNNNDADNRPENLVWAHAKCNELKKKNTEWQVLASDKLRKNVKWNSEYVGEGRRNNTAHTQIQPNEQIDANADACNEAEKYLAERLLPQMGKPAIDDKIDFNKAADVISYRCYKKQGHGSQNTMTRILKMLTCDDSLFDRVKLDGRTWIVRRTGQ
jgi:hypothetical protein